MDPDTMSTWRHVTSYPSPDEVIEEYLGQEEFHCVFFLFFVLLIQVGELLFLRQNERNGR